jgi:hypothetical protein
MTARDNANTLRPQRPKPVAETVSRSDGEADDDLKSWWCHKCCVEVYDRRCPHCGKRECDEN